MTQGDSKWDAMSDEEFIADYVAKHGIEAARAIAKTMGMEPPKPGVKPYQRDRVGAKPVKTPAWSMFKVRTGPSLREIKAGRKASDDPVTVQIRFANAAVGRQLCPVCGLAIGRGEEHLKVIGADRTHPMRTQRFHPVCYGTTPHRKTVA